jgi:hypothetical protein
MTLPTRYKIVETDNFGGDYPDEKFLNLPATSYDKAVSIANAINATFNPDGHADRYWMVRPENYKLVPGFEP